MVSVILYLLIYSDNISLLITNIKLYFIEPLNHLIGLKCAIDITQIDKVTKLEEKKKKEPNVRFIEYL